VGDQTSARKALHNRVHGHAHVNALGSEVEKIIDIHEVKELLEQVGRQPDQEGSRPVVHETSLVKLRDLLALMLGRALGKEKAPSKSHRKGPRARPHTIVSRKKGPINYLSHHCGVARRKRRVAEVARHPARHDEPVKAVVDIRGSHTQTKLSQGLVLFGPGKDATVNTNLERREALAREKMNRWRAGEPTVRPTRVNNMPNVNLVLLPHEEDADML